MGEHDTGEGGFGRRQFGPHDLGAPAGAGAVDPSAIDPSAIDPTSIDPGHEAFPDREPASQPPPAGRPRLPRPEPATAAGSGGGRDGIGGRHGAVVIDGPQPQRAHRSDTPVKAAPSVEHDGWRSSDTIDIDEPPRRRFGFSFQVPPYMKVAAVIAVATSFGALAGTFAATSFGPEPAAPIVRVTPPDDSALRATVADLQRDVAGLRTSLESATKTLQTQTAKLADRLERTEKAQAEPAQKLAKLGEAIDRLEKRTAQAGVQAGATQTQGPGAPPSTLQAQASAQQPPAGQPGPSQPTQIHAAAPPAPPASVAVASADMTTASLGDPRPPAPPVVSGWVVRDVRRGIALIEGRYGLVEVETGDTLPGLGRIESIRKQDGRWLVVTSRGVIVAR
ncbi:coiled-coil domain-containing protein [Rhodoplanes azumiensis]|uniref:Coiled-coil domain-containing protein n=1 Tax=Rhodoplanes azumiensis TaxID=1897628 RepID=A0ABW5APS1_9BRAD